MSHLYTKTGDDGLTNLYDMRRLEKHSLFFEALGDLDELSACIGVVCADVNTNDSCEELLRIIQNKLLDIGSDIATTQKRDKVTEITEADIKMVEKYIDHFDSLAPKLTEFILPGYKTVDAHLHVCRAVCRRAERHMWALKSNGSVFTGRNAFVYINRLSDLLFAMARFHSEGRDITRSQANAYNLEKDL